MAQTLCFALPLLSPVHFPSRPFGSSPPKSSICFLPPPLARTSLKSRRGFYPFAAPVTSGPPCASNDGVEVRNTATELEGDFLSGEWPENFSILNYEDLSAHYESVLFKAELQPDTFLADVMSRTIYAAGPSQLLEEVDHLFTSISGLPVIDEDSKCIGVLSKKDRNKASKGLKSTVGEVMSSPAITLSADKTVKDAAVLMLKNKIHRIPILNDLQQVVGIVTRTDIFTALEGGS